MILGTRLTLYYMADPVCLLLAKNYLYLQLAQLPSPTETKAQTLFNQKLLHSGLLLSQHDLATTT